MAYQVNKTDGTIVATVADGQVDQLSTDLTLIGKNYSGFGESLNENFIKLLENFADSARPVHPIRGQIWYDSSESRLKVYNGNEFVPVSSATISATQPNTLGVGDLWFNSVDKQLYFYDGTNPILLAPAYSEAQGKSGFEVKSILDTLNQTRVVTYLYNNGILLGIFAKDSFTPKIAIAGFSGSIQPGFNAGTISGFKFNVTATNAEQLGGAPAITYVRKDTSNIIDGQVRITADLGLVVGSAGQANLTVTGGSVVLSNSATDSNLILNVRKGIIQEDAIKISSGTRTVDIYADQLSSTVNIGGSLVIEGDLTVKGSAVTIDTQTVVVEDKNLVLAKQTGITPTDANASGGGIILQGSSSHVFVWSENNQAATSNSSEATSGGYNDSLPELYSTAWNSSDHINLATGKYFAIDGVPVLTGNSLGLGITSIPGVTSFGTLSSLNVGPASVDTVRIENNKISIENSALPNLEIEPIGDVALIGSPKITGLGTPTANNHATNKSYVDGVIRSRPVVLSVVIDLNNPIANSYISTYILPNVAPVAEYDENTFARVYCTIVSNNSALLDINPAIQSGLSRALFDQNGVPLAANAVTGLSIAAQTVPAQDFTMTREIRSFRIVAGAWTFVPGSTVSLP